MNGLVRALVTDNKDPEKLGRVKIRFPWLGETAGRRESVWARMARLVSHSHAGDWALPDIGDEVLVGFEFDRMESPVVVGSIYNEHSRPPQSSRSGSFNENGKNNLRFIRTKSGHEIVFDDLEGSESVSIIAKNGAKIVLDAAQKKIEISDSKGNEISLNESSGEIRIQSAEKIMIEAASKIELGKGSLETLVKGESFMTAFNTHTHDTGRGPSSPPLQPMTQMHLTKKVKAE